MKMLAVLTFIALNVTISSQSWACGGDDLTDAEVKTTGQVVKAFALIQKDTQEKFEIAKILRPGNQLLSLDEKPGAAAMCNANFVHVYINGDQGTRCLTILDVRAGKKTHPSFSSVLCRSKDGETKSRDIR